MPGSWPNCCTRICCGPFTTAGAELSDHHQRPGACHDPGEGCVSKLGYSLRGEASLWTAPSPGVAGQDPGARRAPPGRVLLRRVGRFTLAPLSRAERAT